MDFSEQIKDIVKKRHFSLAEDESEATHIIHPSGDADNDAYCRPVFKKGEKCLVHFYRFPVSNFFYFEFFSDFKPHQIFSLICLLIFLQGIP